MRVQEYMTKEDCSINVNFGGNKTLEAGSFVKPINEYYLPRHVKDSEQFQRWCYNKNHETWVYCFYGIVLIPTKVIREVG